MALWKLRLMPLLLLFALLPGAARAQDVFNAGNASNVLSDAASTSCIEKQQPNIWKQLGLNPLTCSPQSMGDYKGQCILKGATVLAHQGGTCYYCVPLAPPGDLYVPTDMVQAVSVQGYTCGESPVDPGCMAVCRKQPGIITTTVPPPPQPTTGGGGGPATLQGSTTNTACPSGQLTYNWPANQAAILQKAESDAKTMLQKAKTYTDKQPWDAGTQAIAVKWFGNAALQTQATMRSRVNGELSVLSTFTSVNQNFYPDPTGQAAYASVSPEEVANPVIYIGSLFWPAGTTGPDSQAATIVHELSHLAPGGSTGDPAYGEFGCQLLVMQISAGQALAQAGQTIGQALGQVAGQVAQAVTGKAPPPPAPPAPAPTSNAATVNADSFEYFVYYVSQQK